MAREKSGAATAPGAGNAPAMEYATFLEERNAKIALADQQSLFIDKSLLTLSASALGLTLTFLHEHSGSRLGWLATGGIIALTLSLGSVLASLYASQRSISRHVDILDDWCAAGFAPSTQHKKQLREIPWVTVALWLNRCAALTFGAGIAGIAAFVIETL